MTVGRCIGLATLLGLVAMAAGASASAQSRGPARLLDDFEAAAGWHVATTDDVKATLRPVSGQHNGALCVDFDFGAVSGYVSLSRELPLTYPDNFEFSFYLRADAPASALQFKLVDASGENVWWANYPEFAFPREWQRMRIRKRQISFAWGPSSQHDLKHSARLEIVIARGQHGGKGSVCFDQLSLLALPAASSLPAPAPAISASSTLPPTRPEQAIDASMDTAWRSDPLAGAEQRLTLDLKTAREFGGIVLHWLPGAYASRYTIELSEDGRQWRTVREVVDGNGGTDAHFLPESQARYVRLDLHDGPARAYGLAEIDIKDPAYGASPNAFITANAKDAPRGHYPRAFLGEQSYWTVLGVDGGLAQGLLAEDGALEFGPQSGSVEPFLLVDGRLVSWADVEARQSLKKGYLPIPSVTWLHSGLTLRTSVFATGDRARSQLVASYTVENHSSLAREVTLALALRPFQVNPPTQFLNQPGGVSFLHQLSWDGQALNVNGQRRLWPLEQPDRVIAADFDAGDVAQLLESDHAAASAVDDATGFASALLLYRLELPPGSSRSIGWVAPLTGAPSLPTGDPREWLNDEENKTAAAWEKSLNLVSFRLPPKQQELADTLRSSLAQILISRSGAALQPGSRSYARSWIRDGSMMSDALLRMGHAEVVREYARWFASHQFSNGKVPCCIDSRGADPVAENDSQGELIHLIDQAYRYTRDPAWLRNMWPHVLAAAQYMNVLSDTQRTAQNLIPERRAFYGLMPPSISHEGYSDKPAYSYWDDFWSLNGYAGAARMAKALGLADSAALSARREQFEADLLNSLRTVMAQRSIGYIPASADRGDFDPSATTIALSVAGLQSELPQDDLSNTFERYWQEFTRRRDGAVEWSEYTPYELRIVGAFVRLGWRDRALQLLDFFLADRRPAAWNQWAEVVGRDARQSRFLGDMPHAWIASDFIQSALDLFAYERPAQQALVLAAGVPDDWLAGEGIAIENLRTPYGNLSYGLRREAQQLKLHIAAGLHPPAGALVYRWPYASAPGAASINDKPAQWEKDGELRIRETPAWVTIELSARQH